MTLWTRTEGACRINYRPVAWEDSRCEEANFCQRLFQANCQFAAHRWGTFQPQPFSYSTYFLVRAKKADATTRVQCTIHFHFVSSRKKEPHPKMWFSFVSPTKGHEQQHGVVVSIVLFKGIHAESRSFGRLRQYIQMCRDVQVCAGEVLLGLVEQHCTRCYNFVHDASADAVAEQCGRYRRQTMFEIAALVVSAAVAVMAIIGFLFSVRDKERAVESMLKSAKEAEDEGDQSLADRRYAAADRMSR